MATRKTAVPRKSAAARKKPAVRAKPVWQRVARPDSIDFRDRRYLPNVALAPTPTLYPPEPMPVKHQGGG